MKTVENDEASCASDSFSFSSSTSSGGFNEEVYKDRILTAPALEADSYIYTLPPADDETTYECPIPECGQVFDTGGNRFAANDLLRLHIWTAHRGASAPTYSCARCGQVSPTYIKLCEHIREVHEPAMMGKPTGRTEVQQSDERTPENEIDSDTATDASTVGRKRGPDADSYGSDGKPDEKRSRLTCDTYRAVKHGRGSALHAVL